MSRDYRLLMDQEMAVVTSPTMRRWCQRPGKFGDDGKPMYLTEQSHKKECDVNLIVKKYDKTGLISHVSKFEAKYGNLGGADFKSAMDLIAGAKSSFESLPSNIRKKFRNSTEAFLSFMENPANRDEAINLGLIRSEWTESTDGLGEHVKLGENVRKPAPVPKEKT